MGEHFGRGGNRGECWPLSSVQRDFLGNSRSGEISGEEPTGTNDILGISEDSATGTSAAALSCVLYRYGQVESVPSLQLVFEQGYSINQPSELHVLLKVTNDAISKVEVAGRATLREVREFN